MLSVQDFSIARKDFSLSVPSLELPSSGLYLLMGENGSGKSSLLGALSGISTAYSGSICFQERELKTLSRLECAARISYLPQNTEPLPGLLGSDFTAQGLFAGGASRIPALLEHFQMSALLQKRCDCCSGGEAQILRLARACAAPRPLILLDEPESFLSRKRRDLLHGLLAELSVQSLVIAAVHDPVPGAFPLILCEEGEGSFLLTKSE